MGRIKIDVKIIPKFQCEHSDIMAAKLIGAYELSEAISNGDYSEVLNDFKYKVDKIFLATDAVEGYAYDNIHLETKYFRYIGNLIKYLKKEKSCDIFLNISE